MHRVDTEVGALRTVLLHRPGNELKRLTPRNSADLLFDGIPWVGRAQSEHDAFAEALRLTGTEVLYLSDLVREVLAVEVARTEVLDTTIRPQLLGPTLATALRAHLDGLHPDDLAEVVMAGLAHDELHTATGLLERLAGAHDFIVPPLPNLLFTRDSSVWTADHVTITRPSMPARQREVALTGAVYLHHPRFTGTPVLYGA
ncbi:MAG: arginine deiminase, partial [Frankiales bacterium]|nr:arginine deiminase [Frankiales bacterium]